MSRIRPYRIIKVLILCAWAVLMAWLIRYEAFPELFTRSLDGYESVIGRDVMITESWMRILYQGQPVGYTHSNLDINENDPEGRFVLKQAVVLGLYVMGTRQNVGIDADITLNIHHQLRGVNLDISLGTFKGLLKAAHVEGESYDVVWAIGPVTNRMAVTIPADAIIYMPMQEMAVRRLKPGRSLNLRVFDPVAMDKAIVTVTALRIEPVPYEGKPVAATVLESEYRGMKTTSWVDSYGRVLRQESGMGWTLEACSSDQAFLAFRNSRATVDMFRSLTGPMNPFSGAPAPESVQENP